MLDQEKPVREEIGVAIAAKILGVSVSTLKRLCDEGLIPTCRTEGGHRRFDKFQMEQTGRRLQGKAGEYLADARSDARGRFLFMLLVGYEQGILNLLNSLCAGSTSMASVLDQHFVPALVALHSRAPSARQAEMAEETARAVVTNLLAHQQLPGEDSPAMVGIAVGTAQRELASELVELALRCSGIAARSLGGTLESDQLIDHASKHKVSAVWLALLHDSAFSELVTLSQSLRGKLPGDVPVLIYSGCRSLSEHASESIRAYFTSLQALCLHLAADCGHG